MDKWILAARFIGIGWYIGISITGGIFGGIWLDEHFGTSIVFTLIGVFLGLIVAALGTYKMIQPLIHKQNNKGPEGMR